MIERVFSIDIAAPVQRVWDEITRRGAPQAAMFGGYLNSDLEPGSVMSYRNRPGTHTFVLGEVLEIEPPRRLVHTFRFSMQQDDPTLVAWKLAEHNGMTRVTVTHSRLVPETRTCKKVSGGWPLILRILKQVAETGRPPLSARLRNGLFMSLCFMLPATTRTDNALKLNLRLPATA